ncbi:uncharacterized protein LOC5507304 isoform X2 [Nematostella vectensis]|uniref:uncharacterized protein LOC5507304 isoform X2 n=1 Tax=Nematostella vectensis TaxID=45351 RepID=UPI00138FD316|nr:uncharacterized protein LOC5507304 isoform X2 [Nematostella vectensis]
MNNLGGVKRVHRMGFYTLLRGKMFVFFLFVVIYQTLLSQAREFEFANYLRMPSLRFNSSAPSNIVNVTSLENCVFECVGTEGCKAANVGKMKNAENKFPCELFTTISLYNQPSLVNDENFDVIKFAMCYPEYPCENGGICLAITDGPRCICPIGFTGSSCENVSRDCSAIRASGVTVSGVYDIDPEGLGRIKVYCDMTIDGGGWTMVFKVESGASAPGAANLWVESQVQRENDTEVLTVIKTTSEHYKNRIVNNWETFDPKEVLMVVYKNGVPDLQLRFNAKGSDRVNWYEKTRLLSSPWTDLMSGSASVIEFNLVGWCNPVHPRRCRMFYTMSQTGGCPTDTGWLMVTEKGCSEYETDKPYNTILYSMKVSLKVSFAAENPLIGDVLLVFVR